MSNQTIYFNPNRIVDKISEFQTAIIKKVRTKTIENLTPLEELSI